jgi:hypothetical protein
LKNEDDICNYFYKDSYSMGMLLTAALAATVARRLTFWGVLLCASTVLLLSTPLLAKPVSPQPAVSLASGG